MNSKTQKAIACLLLGSGLLYGSTELLLKLGCEIGHSRSFLNTYRLVTRLNRTQSLYNFFEPEIDSHSRFIKQELSDIRLKNYRYSTEITEGSAFSQAVAIASEKDLCAINFAPLLSFTLDKDREPRYTLIGAVFFSQQGLEADKDIICQSQTPGWQQLPKPYLKDGKPVCGEGTQEFIVN